MCKTNDRRINQQTVLVCFPSNEKDPCTDSDNLSGRQVPAVSHALRNIITISIKKKKKLYIFYSVIWKNRQKRTGLV